MQSQSSWLKKNDLDLSCWPRSVDIVSYHGNSKSVRNRHASREHELEPSFMHHCTPELDPAAFRRVQCIGKRLSQTAFACQSFPTYRVGNPPLTLQVLSISFTDLQAEMAHMHLQRRSETLQRNTKFRLKAHATATMLFYLAGFSIRAKPIPIPRDLETKASISLIRTEAE